MASELPTELIELIFSFVDPSDKQACAAVCATNKLGQRVVTPLMYLSVGTAADATIQDDREGKRSWQLGLLCRTLIENRGLASQVNDVRVYIDQDFLFIKRVAFPLDKSTCSRFMRDELNFPYELVESILDGLFIAMANESYAESEDGDMTADNSDELLSSDWTSPRVQDKHQRNATYSLATAEESYILLLQILCDRLRSLTFTSNLSVLKKMPHLTDILQHAINYRNDTAPSEMRRPVSGILTVRDVTLEHTENTEDGSEFVVQDIKDLLRFPSIRSLHISTLWYSDSWHLIADALSSIRSLEINNCFAKADDLAYLLHGCNDLRKLYIQYAVRESAHRRSEWRDLGTALRVHCPLLEDLVVNHAHDHMMDDEDFYHSGYGDMDDDYMLDASLAGLGSLSDLKHLTKLTITKIALFGTQKDAWISKTSGANGLQQERDRAAAARRLELAAQRQEMAAQRARNEARRERARGGFANRLWSRLY